MVIIMLDYTQYFRLRKPKWTDYVDETDFNRFCTTNLDVIDAEMYHLSEALSALATGGGGAATPEELGALQTSVSNLAASLENIAARLTEVESGGVSADLSAVNSTIASVQQTLGNYGTRITVLEQGGIPTTTLDAINDSLSAVRQTQAGYGTRIASLENADHTVNLAPLEGRVEALEGILPDVLPVANGLTGRVAALESAQATHNGFSGRFDALETLVGTLSGRMNTLTAAVHEIENISGIADTTALDNRISALGSQIAADITLLSSRIATLESAAFTDLREGGDGYWYAYNKSGVQVDGPLRMGYLNGGRTWADVFEVTATPEPAPEPSLAPRTWAQIFGITA